MKKLATEILITDERLKDLDSLKKNGFIDSYADIIERGIQEMIDKHRIKGNLGD